MSLALMRALRRWGIIVQSFTRNPDYLDTAFHAVCGTYVHRIDVGA